MHTFETPNPITIEVRHTAGTIDIELSDTELTTVELSVTSTPEIRWLADLIGSFGGYGYHGDPSAALDRVIVNYLTTEQPDDTSGCNMAPDRAATTTPGASYGRLSVDTRRAHPYGSSAISVRITAPRRSSIESRSESASLHVVGEAGNVTVRTISGTVNVANSASDTTIRTVSGEVELGLASGVLAAVTLNSVSGEISSDLPIDADPDSARRQPDAQIQIRTVSGDILLHRATAT